MRCDETRQVLYVVLLGLLPNGLVVGVEVGVVIVIVLGVEVGIFSFPFLSFTMGQLCHVKVQVSNPIRARLDT